MTLHASMGRLGLTHPVFQAPIGSIASPELAAAVSNTGGLGHLACTWRSPDQLRALFAAMAGLTSRPYGANFVLDFPIDERLDVALAHGVRLISFFWGDGGRHVARVKAAGAVAVQVIGSIEEAKRAADAGFDLIVAQGREAGGHVRGSLGTMTLVPQVVDAVSPLPVLAGGGIVDRRGVAAAEALGASGVWVGTRFLAAAEANIHPRYQELVLASCGDDTLYSELFDGGWPNAPLRTLKTATTRNWEAAGRPSAPNRPGEGEIVAQRSDGSGVPRYFFSSPTRDVSGDVEAMALYVGEGVGLVHSREAASVIVAELATGFRETAPAKVAE
ncbi:nitronate monooxygenase [Rhizobiales bacterium GAS191]|nr:nitronate monooxygenase [Rhizobiales bacterium GAS188]SED29682.1 nitronate monooxygenase [Rhizobiales bacterium GAS191]